ncbi:transcription factor domain-containing protein [Aspergillus novofumigatus IBT 16806]|uniref:Zn(2)-C6 fungal-type domain-containing protein n=1 Tax=Aspergillus novofumigatus (strain IBT 16806) TaxID=1392255 RepID=A0A2I1BXI7_ASPN1|nr:uncharacterized protein P174DRAFT_515255 [Aspergillus novofumigatus IBT 16806]PKX90031.1 hypothetical protein P174DRAFT_515255 [Aspergillus novofumigatus IBT 16806]
MDDTTGYVPAPYGRACANCARAKCKCILPEAGGICARCYRLNKECRPSARVRRTRRNTPIVSKAVQLEQKLDGLLSLLQANQSQSMPECPSPEIPGQDQVSPRRQDVVAPLLTPEGSTPHGNSPGRSFTTSVGPAEVCSSNTADANAEEVLNCFRNGPLAYLPFVHIPDSVSAAQLEMESPFLWYCICAVQCKHTARQSALSVSIREKAAQALLVDCRKNLDILQGLLVYLGWITFHCQPQKYSLCPPDESHPADCDWNGPTHNLKFPVSRTRTMNERRALLGCFLLSSFISQFLCKPDPLRWTAHMKECLEVLTARKETPNDAVLVQLVQIQLVVDKVIRRSWDENGLAAEDSPRLPTSFFIQTMQHRLQSTKSRIPPEVADNKVVLFHLYQAEVAVYESALSRSATRVEDVDVTRISHLYACLSATKNWVDLLLTVGPEEYVFLPVTIIFQVSHCLSTLFYLSTFGYPGWDREAVTRTADLQSIAQQIIGRLDSVAEAAGIQNEGTDGDSWSKAARILPKLQASWASRLPNAVAIGENSDGQSSALPSVDEDFLEACLNWPDVWLMEPWMQATQNGL